MFLGVIAKLLYAPMRAVILETWASAWKSATAEIQARVAAETDLGPPRLLLAELSGDSPAAIESGETGKKAGKKLTA